MLRKRLRNNAESHAAPWFPDCLQEKLAIQSQIRGKQMKTQVRSRAGEIKIIIGGSSVRCRAVSSHLLGGLIRASPLQPVLAVNTLTVNNRIKVDVPALFYCYGFRCNNVRIQ